MLGEPPICYRLSIPESAPGCSIQEHSEPGWCPKIEARHPPWVSSSCFFRDCARFRLPWQNKVTSAARAPLIHNPFAPLDAQQEIVIKVQNTENDGCAWELSIPDRCLAPAIHPQPTVHDWPEARGGRALFLPSRRFCSPVNLMTCALTF